MTHTQLVRNFGAALLTLICLAAPVQAADVTVDGQFVSLEAAAPPLEVSSDARVDNLNADLLDGFTASDFITQTQPRYHRVVFATPGTSTFTVPAGVNSLDVTVIGGGGGGGGALYEGGGGGGGSGLVVSTTVFVDAGEVLTVVVGEGGAGGASGDDGQPGQPSSLISSSGWRVQANGGQGGTLGDFYRGGFGGSGFFGGGGGYYGGHGGDGILADGELGVPPGTGAGASGGDGAGIFGGGGGGGPGGGDGGSSGVAGSPGTQPGAGGGGGGEEAPGGDGAAGAIIIEWFG